MANGWRRARARNRPLAIVREGTGVTSLLGVAYDVAPLT